MTRKSRLITVAGAKVIIAVAILHISKFFPQYASGWKNNVPFSPPTLNTLPAFSNYFYSGEYLRSILERAEFFDPCPRTRADFLQDGLVFSLFSPRKRYSFTLLFWAYGFFPSILKQPPCP